MTDFEVVLKALVQAKVNFVIVGAFAAVAQGFSQPTRDLDICYERSPENLRKLAAALAPFHPRLRGIAQSLPFSLDPEALAQGMNFTLDTNVGEIDLMGELSGIGQFAAAFADSHLVKMFDMEVRIASLDLVIRSKRAAGRPKDLAAIPELEALRELQNAAKPKPDEKS